jgi:hypothetical protein
LQHLQLDHCSEDDVSSGLDITQLMLQLQHLQQLTYLSLALSLLGGHFDISSP